MDIRVDVLKLIFAKTLLSGSEIKKIEEQEGYIW